MPGRTRYRDRVTIRNAALVDGYGGQKVRNWDDESTITTTPRVPAEVQFQASSEDLESRDTTSASWRLFTSPDAPLTATSRIRWAGVAGDLQVEGTPGLITYRGRPHHLEVTLTQVVDHDGAGDSA